MSPAIAPGSAQASWRPTYVKAFNDYLTHLWRRRRRPDLAAAADRHRLAEMRRPAVRNSAVRAPGRTSSRRCAMSATMSSRGSARSKSVSVYRNPALNACAGGAPESTHRILGAVDMVPLRPITPRGADDPACARSTDSGERHIASALAFTRASASTSTPRNIANGELGRQGRLRLHRRAGRGRGRSASRFPDSATAAPRRRPSSVTAQRSAGSPRQLRPMLAVPGQAAPGSCVAQLTHHMAPKLRGIHGS